MTPDSLAKEKTRQRLLTLKQSENTIRDEIILRYGTIGKKLNEWASIVDERIELLDSDLPTGLTINQISTYISTALRENNQPSLASHVSEHLPTKYKNQNLVRIQQTITKLNEIGAEVGPHLPEECSSAELEMLYEANEKAKNELDNAVSRYNKEQEKIEFIAQQKGFQLAGYKFRREISHTDFSEPTPEELMKYVTQMRDLFYEASDTFKTLGDKYFADPPRVLAELVQDIDVMTVYCATLKGHGKDYKMTGNLDHSMERQYVSDMSGKHAAGNSDKFPTLLCNHCSKFETYDPDNFEIMKFDHTSPSNYRCAKCGGVDVIERGMSREQVGDRAAFLYREAQNIVRAIPLFGITLQRWTSKYIQPKEDSRKTVIAEFFVDSSLSGASYKVAKKPPNMQSK